nr:response regulator [Acinetobacter sp. Marseille-Q1620]
MKYELVLGVTVEIIKILFVEDNDVPIRIFENELADFNDEINGFNIQPVIARTYDEAIHLIDKSFDAIIMDLALGNNQEAGNELVRILEEKGVRIPIIFVSGNHSNVVAHPLIINIRARDQGDYEQDFYNIVDVYKTGLTNILGGRGEIEKKLSEIFTETVLPELEIWKKYASEQREEKHTEKALLRLVVNHLNHLLEEDEIPSYPEEFYIYPVKDEILRTGTILKSKSSDIYYISLSPACDLAQRNGVCKTDRLLIAEIEPVSQIKSIIYQQFESQPAGKRKDENIAKELKKYFSNNFSNYHHSLPKIKKFVGGFINFRKAQSLTQDQIDLDYEIVKIQVAAPFIKDVLSRFSSYYARQGQPVIYVDDHIQEIIAS